MGNSRDFSIIIPVYHESEYIEPCIRRLERLDLIDRSEIIVVDGGNGSTVARLLSIDSTLYVRSVLTAPGRGGQLRSGAETAIGRFLVFLHVDTVLPGNALSLVGSSLENSVAGAFRFRIRSTSPAIRFVGIAADIRSRLSRIPYGDQVHFFRADEYGTIGGYRDSPIMEDVEIMRRLKSHKVDIDIVRRFALTDDRRWRKEGILFVTMRNWCSLLLYRIGVPAEQISNWYRPHRER